MELIFLRHFFGLNFITHWSILISKLHLFQIMEERSALSDRVSDGHVLVQFYGNHPRYCSVYFIPGSFLDLPNPAYWLYFVDLQCLDWSSNRCFSFWGCELNPCPTLCFCKHKFRVFRSHYLVFAFWWRNLYLMNKTTSRGGGGLYTIPQPQKEERRGLEKDLFWLIVISLICCSPT